MIEQFFVPTEDARKKVLNLKIDKNCAMVAEQFSVTTEGTTISSFCLKSQKKNVQLRNISFSHEKHLSVTQFFPSIAHSYGATITMP